MVEGSSKRLQTSAIQLRKVRVSPVPQLLLMMLCMALPRRLAAFTSIRASSAAQRLRIVVDRFHMANINTDNQGRRIRGGQRAEYDDDDDDDGNDWISVDSWDVSSTSSAMGSGGGWDDFDPLSAPSPKPSRRTSSPRNQDWRRGDNNNSNSFRNRDGRRSSSNSGPRRGGPSSRRDGPTTPGGKKDASQKKINLKALEGAGYDHLYGLAPVRNALRAQRRSLVPLESRFILDYDETEEAQSDERKPEAQFRPYLFLQERKGKAGRSGDKSLQAEEVQRLAEELELPIVHVDKGVLNTLSGNRPHQGCVLRCGKLEFEPLTRIPDDPESPKLWLVLDQIVDPQNLGALLRSAYFFGHIGVLVCAKNSAPPSPTVSASSAGALEDMTVYSTNNLPRTLAAAEQEGFRIIGASASSPPDSDIPVYDLEKLPPSDKDARPTLLVLGSEGHGIRSLVASSCTEFVKIPGADHENLGVDSLNVSVTGGILMCSLVNKFLLNAK